MRKVWWPNHCFEPWLSNLSVFPSDFSPNHPFSLIPDPQTPEAVLSAGTSRKIHQPCLFWISSNRDLDIRASYLGIFQTGRPRTMKAEPAALCPQCPRHLLSPPADNVPAAYDASQIVRLGQTRVLGRTTVLDAKRSPQMRSTWKLCAMRCFPSWGHCNLSGPFLVNVRTRTLSSNSFAEIHACKTKAPGAPRHAAALPDGAKLSADRAEVGRPGGGDRGGGSQSQVYRESSYGNHNAVRCCMSGDSSRTLLPIPHHVKA